MYDEVTASSLIKASFQGDIVDNGTTTLGVDRTAVAVHAAVYSASKDVSCVIHVASSPAVSVREDLLSGLN
jgi:ribulose-5-phosphate 4-epimerase/fuculose-1-phosphate aldolase